MTERAESPSLADVSAKAQTYDPAALEFQSRIIHGHSQNTGFFFGRFCSGFAAYSRNLAEIRDKGDEIARNFAQYSATQSHSPMTKIQLTEFSGLLAAVQDHMQARILRIENKVVAGFAKYGTMCHKLKREVEKGVTIRDREQKYQDDIQRMSVKMKSNTETSRQQKIDSASTAASDARHAHEILLHEADKFEQQKLEDLRRVLMNFCEIELAFHSKALKLYTQAYRSAKRMDKSDDVAKFRTQMNIVKGSTSVGPDPNLILENSQVGCVPPESSSESDLSSASLSDGEEQPANTKLERPPRVGMRLSANILGKTLKPRKNASLIEKFSPMLLTTTKLKRERTRYVQAMSEEKPRKSDRHRYKTMPAGTCADHFAEYEKAIQRRRSSQR